MNKLIPCKSTHFLYVGGDTIPDVELTKGRVYKIEEWKRIPSVSAEYCYYFYDNKERLRVWHGTIGVVDVNFEENLKNILEE